MQIIQHHPNENLNKRIELALSLIIPINRILLKYFLNSIEYENKSDGSMVSIADITVEMFLKNKINSIFNQDCIISEETNEISGSTNYTWTIDPIDGTLSFVSGVPFYSCLISIIYKNTPVFGLAIFPSMDEYIFGIAGLGTFWKKPGNKTYIKISTFNQNESIERLVWGYTDLKFFNSPKLQELFSKLQNQFKYNRSWGDAYGHILVATNRLGLMIDPNPYLKLWDIAPLLPIVQEAGGYNIVLPEKTDIFQASGLISCHNDKFYTLLMNYFNE